MANRRMFNKELVSSDKFIDMPVSTQLLFFHLGMNADDEGFVSSPKRIMRSVCCSEDDLKILLSKGFLIVFESGVVVIKEWDKHNQIRKDRLTPTIHHEEKQSLQLTDIQQAQPIDNQKTTNGLPSVVEVRRVENRIEENSTTPKSEKGALVISFWNETFSTSTKVDRALENELNRKIDEYGMQEVKRVITDFHKYFHGEKYWINTPQTLFSFVKSGLFGKIYHATEESMLITSKKSGNNMRNGKVKDEIKEPDYNVEDFMMR